MNPALFLQLLKSFQAQLVALSMSVDSIIAIMPEEAKPSSMPTCPHPRDKRIDISVMGGPQRFICNACGQQVVIPEEAAAPG